MMHPNWAHICLCPGSHGVGVGCGGCVGACVGSAELSVGNGDGTSDESGGAAWYHRSSADMSANMPCDESTVPSPHPSVQPADTAYGSPPRSAPKSMSPPKSAMPTPYSSPKPPPKSPLTSPPHSVEKPHAFISNAASSSILRLLVPWCPMPFPHFIFLFCAFLLTNGDHPVECEVPRGRTGQRRRPASHRNRRQPGVAPVPGGARPAALAGPPRSQAPTSKALCRRSPPHRGVGTHRGGVEGGATRHGCPGHRAGASKLPNGQPVLRTHAGHAVESVWWRVAVVTVGPRGRGQEQGTASLEKFGSFHSAQTPLSGQGT